MKNRIIMFSVVIILSVSILFTGCDFGFVTGGAHNSNTKAESSESDTNTVEISTEAHSESEKIEQNEETSFALDKTEPIENSSNLTSAGQPYNSVSQVYYKVCDSVVEIITETVQTNIFFGQYVSEGAGSGVIIDESGLIVTNHHVIEGASHITVRLIDDVEFEASVVGSDAAADIAVIKIDPEEHRLVAAEIGCSSDLKMGEDIIVIGNPLGKLGGTLTTGIISATARSIVVEGTEMVLLQTNAAINPGNSGGGMFNMAGQLVGVVNSKASGTGIEGIGFAIPVDYAHKVMEDLINYGYVRGIVDHGLIMLDVSSQNLPTAYRKYGITQTGIIIIESKYSSELKYGDRIISINGEEVGSSSEVTLVMKKYSVGDTVKVKVSRNGVLYEASITLAEKVPADIVFN
jgi:serine protease Do